MSNTEMRLAKEGLLKPRETFQRKHSNQYFTANQRPGGVADDHVPFIQRSKSLLYYMHLYSP